MKNPSETNSTPQQPDNVTQIKKKLAKSNSGKIIAGVCAGIADYLEVEAFWVRLIFILLALPAGLGILLYFLAVLFLPKGKADVINVNFDFNYLIGLTLIFLSGALLFLESPLLNFVNWFALPPEALISLSLITIGIFYIVKALALTNKGNLTTPNFNQKKFLGVNLFLAKYSGLSVHALRMFWVIFSFVTFGFGILVYLLVYFLIKGLSVEN